MRVARWLLLASCLWAAAPSGARAQGAAQTVIAHWPHSPVSHLLHHAAPRTTPSFSANLRGGFVTASNTLLTCPGNARRRGHRAAEPCVDRNNNDENMRYVNVDPGNGRFDSSTASLTLPDGARVVRAYLYWGADLARGVDKSNTAADGAPGGETPNDADHPAGTNRLWRAALLRFGAAPYTTVDATAPERDGVWQGIESWYSTVGQSPGFAYQVRADVTPEVAAALAAARAHRARAGRLQKTLSATVANVQAGQGYNRHGGWTLLVAWETPTDPYRDLTLYDGFAYVQVEGGQQKVVGPLDFSGFQTPTSGPVDAHLATWTYEGDRSITGDYFALGAQGKTCAQLGHMKDALNPIDNFFNGTISTGGVDLGGRTPSFANQLGFDRDRLSVPEGTIPNHATGARVCLGTSGDTYFFGGIAFDTLIRAPNLRIAKSASATTANPGDQIVYTTQVSNPQRPQGETPTDAATNVVVDDPLPSGLDFVAFTVNPGGACAYDPDTRTIHCAVGTLAPDAVFSFAYRATVSAAAQGTAPATLTNVACYLANSEDQPDDRVPRLCARGRDRPAEPLCGPRRGEDRLGRRRRAGGNPHLDAGGDQPRPGHIDRIPGARRVAAGRRLRERDGDDAADLHHARARRRRRDRVHGSKCPGRRVVDGDHHRLGTGNDRQRHGVAQRGDGQRRPTGAHARPARQPR